MYHLRRPAPKPLLVHQEIPLRQAHVQKRVRGRFGHEPRPRHGQAEASKTHQASTCPVAWQVFCLETWYLEISTQRIFCLEIFSLKSFTQEEVIFTKPSTEMTIFASRTTSISHHVVDIPHRPRRRSAMSITYHPNNADNLPRRPHTKPSIYSAKPTIHHIDNIQPDTPKGSNISATHHVNRLRHCCSVEPSSPRLAGHANRSVQSITRLSAW